MLKGISLIELAGLVTAVAGFVGIYLKYRIDVKRHDLEIERLRMEREVEAKKKEEYKEICYAMDTTLNFISIFLAEKAIRHQVEKLKRDTPIDRVLGFAAFNGMFKPERTTMIFNCVNEEFKNLVGRYEYFKLDPHYNALLSQARNSGIVRITTEELPEYSGNSKTLIKQVYETERVKRSIWMIVTERDLGNGKVVVIYFSFSTHSDENIHAPEIEARCREIVTLFENKLAHHGIETVI